jgi:hypothetical protein
MVSVAKLQSLVHVELHQGILLITKPSLGHGVELATKVGAIK